MLFASFCMGLVGSLHCALMCGPLALALPVVGQTRSSFVASRLVYNFARITVYSVLGLCFGLIGKSLALAGFQQWLSIAAGVSMIAFLLLGLNGVKNPFWKSSLWIRSVFRDFIKRRSYLALFILGVANGLLPCGLVYMAGTASAASGEILQSALCMFTFGLGTLPVMLGMTLSGKSFTRLIQGLRLKPIAPMAVAVVGVALILRGMDLGIPYLSPTVSHGAVACPACAK